MATEEKPEPQAPPPAASSPGASPPPPSAGAAPADAPSPAAPAPVKPAPAYHKKLTGAAQKDSLEKLALQSARRDARAAASEKKYSVGDQLQKTAKPTSRIGRIIKIILILIVVIGIPLPITASFFVRVGKKKELTVAALFWKKIKLLLGLEAPPRQFKRERHPNLVTLGDIADALEKEKGDLQAIDRIISKQDDKVPWEKEAALKLHEKIDGIAEKTKARMEALAQLGVWLQEYTELKGETEKAYNEGVGKDDSKQECAQLLIQGMPIPKGYENLSRDPGVLKYVELCRKMQLDRFFEVEGNEKLVTGPQHEAQTAMKMVRQLRARLPSKIVLGGGGPEAPRKEPAVAPYDPKRCHPWARAGAETWVRFRVTAADGSVSYEDRIVKEVKEDAIVFTGQRASGEQVSDVPEREEKFVPAEVKTAGEEKVKVGDLEILCQVVETGGEKHWIAREGRWANRIVLKTEKDGAATVVAKLGEEALPFKERQYNCITYEIGDVKFWAHEDVPGFVFRVKTAQMHRQVVDFGPALAGRPPFPRAEMKPPEEPKKEEPKKEEPKPEVKIEAPRRPHRWGTFKPGSWVRIQGKEKTAAGEKSGLLDFVVAEVTATEAVVKREGFNPEGKLESEEHRQPLAPEPGKVLREEKLTVGGTEIPCLVVETASADGPWRTWVPKEGRAARLAELKIEGPAATALPVSLGEESLTVAGREVKCIKLEVEFKRGEMPVKVTQWLSEEVPGFQVRILEDFDGGKRVADMVVVDFGDDASKKPPLPPPKKEEPPKAEPPKEEPKKEEPPKEPPPRTADKVLAEAEKLVIDGGVIAKELVEAMKQLPEDEARLKALLRRQEEAVSLFVKARETYLSLGDKAPPEAKVDERLAKIEKILALLQKYGDEIKSKLK